MHELEQGGAPTASRTPLPTSPPEQQQEIERFKRELIETRTELRDVQHNLRQDIDALGDFLAFVNIALVPILVAAFALLLAWLRRRRRARAMTL